MALNPTLSLHLQGCVAKEPSHGRAWILVGGSLSFGFPEQASGDIELSLTHRGQWKVLEIEHAMGGGTVVFLSS